MSPSSPCKNFLTVIPIEGLGQHMSALEYQTILKYQLMIPLFLVDEPCPVCRKGCGIDGADSDYGYVLDRVCMSLFEFNLSGFSNKDIVPPKAQNVLVCALFSEIVKGLGVSFDLSPRQKAAVKCLRAPRLLEGRSALRPADILVYGWVEGKHDCVDLTGVSPFVGLRDNVLVAAQAALKAESSKVAKHKKACLENQHVFILFAFDTFGFLASEAEKFLTRVQRVVQSNFLITKTQNFIFSRIGFAIQKGVATQLVARLPAILL
nr:putative reverse transcriptase domain-containing protein [Tanacetum cinerariifolium]